MVYSTVHIKLHNKISDQKHSLKRNYPKYGPYCKTVPDKGLMTYSGDTITSFVVKWYKSHTAPIVSWKHSANVPKTGFSEDIHYFPKQQAALVY